MCLCQGLGLSTVTFVDRRISTSLCVSEMMSVNRCMYVVQDRVSQGWRLWTSVVGDFKPVKV